MMLIYDWVFWLKGSSGIPMNMYILGKMCSAVGRNGVIHFRCSYREVIATKKTNFFLRIEDERVV